MIWMILLACSFISQTHIDAGFFGLLGFPVMAAVYAFIRQSNDAVREEADPQSPVAHARMGEFLDAHPEFRSVTYRLRIQAFHKWLNNESLRDLQRM